MGHLLVMGARAELLDVTVGQQPFILFSLHLQLAGLHAVSSIILPVTWKESDTCHAKLMSLSKLSPGGVNEKKMNVNCIPIPCTKPFASSFP